MYKNIYNFESSNCLDGYIKGKKEKIEIKEYRNRTILSLISKSKNTCANKNSKVKLIKCDDFLECTAHFLSTGLKQISLNTIYC